VIILNLISFHPYRPVWYVPDQGLYHSIYLGLEGFNMGVRGMVITDMSM